MCFCTVDTGKLVNRGFLNMPLCPIYGTVSLVFAMFLPDLYDRPLFLFLGGMILSAFVEFVSGWMLEAATHAIPVAVVYVASTTMIP